MGREGGRGAGEEVQGACERGCKWRRKVLQGA